MKEKIARYNGLYGDDKAQLSHDYLQSELIVPRTRHTDWGLKPHLHGNLFQLFFLEAGRASFHADAAPVELTTPCIVLIPANTVHSFTFSPQVQGRTLTLAEGLMDTILQAAPAVLVEVNALNILSDFNDEVSFADLLRMEQHIHTELHLDQPGKQLALNAYFKLLFVKIFRLLQHSRKEADNSNRALHYFREFQKAIGAAPSGKKIAEFAQELKITPIHLNRICQAVKGKTAQQIVQAHTIRKAHNYLIYTSLSVSEIAYALQFADAGYFTRFFRKQTGLSPVAYRAKAYRSEGAPKPPKSEAAAGG